MQDLVETQLQLKEMNNKLDKLFMDNIADGCHEYAIYNTIPEALNKLSVEAKVKLLNNYFKSIEEKNKP